MHGCRYIKSANVVLWIVHLCRPAFGDPSQRNMTPNASPISRCLQLFNGQHNHVSFSFSASFPCYDIWHRNVCSFRRPLVNDPTDLVSSPNCPATLVPRLPVSGLVVVYSILPSHAMTSSVTPLANASSFQSHR